MDARRARALRELITVLQRAHAGELAAALAYQGHARSLADPTESAEILEIGCQEMEHRRSVDQMLAGLEGGPSRIREALFHGIGTVLGRLCRLSGWLAPMYGAGLLESGNICEYEEAAGLAILAGRADLAPELLRMAQVEWDHERYFREKVLSRRIPFLPLWAAPPPRESIAPRLDFPDDGFRSRYRSLASRPLEAGPSAPLRPFSSRGTAR